MNIFKRNTQNDINTCMEIAKKLPDYFNEQGIKDMHEDMKKYDLYMAAECKIPLGFAVINEKNPQVAEISWMAVDNELQNRGIGKLMLSNIFNHLKDKGIKVVEVKTLSENVDYKPYESTREFYKKQGFVLLETIDPYPGWGEGNPCAIYIKPL